MATMTDRSDHRAAASPTAVPPTSYQNLPRPQLYATMGGLMVTLLLSALDQTIVGTAMPRIVGDLRGFEHYAWATTAYLLASTAVVPVVGKLSDVYGRKRFLIGGTAFFVAASMLCGLSQDMVQLSVFRGLQGIGGGVLMATVFTVASALFPPAKRARTQGFFSATWGFASITGPLLGGYLTDTLGWRSVFYVNVPVGVVALAVLWLVFAEPPRERRVRSVDFLGAATLVSAVVPFLLALTWGGRDFAWLSPQILGLLGFALAMLATFLVIETRVAEPILPLELFRNRIVAMAGVLSGFAMAGMFGAGLFVPLFAQAVVGTSATESGTVLAPMMIAMIVTSIVAGLIIGHTARYKWMAVASIVASATGMFLLSGMEPDTTYGIVARNIVVVGLGMGATMPCFNLAAQNSVSLSQLGVVTGLVQFLRSIGGTIGTAVLGSMLANGFAPALQAALPASVAAAVPPERMAEISNPQALLNPQAADALRQAFVAQGPAGAQLYDAMTTAVRVALAGSLHDVFLASGIFLSLAAVGTLFLPDRVLHRTFAEAEGHGEPRHLNREGTPSLAG